MRRGARHSHRDQTDHETQVGHNAQETRRQTNQKRIRQSDEQESDRIKNSVTQSHQNLPPEKQNEVVVDGLEHKHQFLLRPRLVDGQIIRPTSLDAPLFQKKIKQINRDQRKTDDQPHPGSHCRELTDEPFAHHRQGLQRAGHPGEKAVTEVLVHPRGPRLAAGNFPHLIRRPNRFQVRHRHGIGGFLDRNQRCLARLLDARRIGGRTRPGPPGGQLDPQRRADHPFLELFLHRLHMAGKTIHERIRFHDHPGNHGCQQRHHQHDHQEKYQKHRPETRDLQGDKIVDHRIQKVGDHSGNRQRQKNHRQLIDHPAQSQNQQTNQCQQHTNRQRRDGNPQNAPLLFSW